MITVFFSYSHRDEAMRDELEVHLSMLQRQGIIETWHDRRIGAGNEFAGAISERLNTCDIILLLVSPYFLASDYCYDVEMVRAMERHKEGSARVIPVILEPCDWHEAPFGKLLAAPKDGKPISKFANMHDGFLDVTKAIRQAAGELGKDDSTAKRTTRSGHETRKGSSTDARSSNLRVTRSFTDSDRDNFLDESFDYISNFFENSLEELASRNPEITTRFKRLSDARFTAFVYRNGRSVSECCVRQGNMLGKSIAYSMNVAADNSYNESLSVGDDGHTLHLRPMGMAMTSPGGRELLSQQGAAEYLWSILMRPLQQPH
ncbi:MAG: toll/interleukin-1 receptor domain-containing protein [Planctomycetes bacterium]|nr:toll/interleukin-1 receptor domain-containing protein [Planctomycetota bacterium]